MLAIMHLLRFHLGCLGQTCVHPTMWTSHKMKWRSTQWIALEHILFYFCLLPFVLTQDSIV
jgi:hypothetical protein